MHSREKKAKITGPTNTREKLWAMQSKHLQSCSTTGLIFTPVHLPVSCTLPDTDKTLPLPTPMKSELDRDIELSSYNMLSFSV